MLSLSGKINLQCCCNMTLYVDVCYLCPCAAARLKEFISPCGVVEMPLRYIVPTTGSAPLSNSRLTSSKFPADKQVRSAFTAVLH